MKEQPILFSEPMVRAILDGHKSQTRRIIKPQPNNGIRRSPFVKSGIEDGHGREVRCPYQPGMRLWVRETWAVYQTVNYIRQPDGRAFSEVSDGHFAYKADGFDTIDDLRTHVRLMSDCSLEAVEVRGDNWRPSIHMPREAARLFLTVKNVRVERLQDITEEDARAEGVESAIWYAPYGKGDDYYKDISGLPGYPDQRASFRNGFATLWDRINAKRGYGWELNPFCWVISFEVCSYECHGKRHGKAS